MRARPPRKGAALLVGVTQAPATPLRQRNAVQPLRPGQVRCPVCSKGVGLRPDGTMRAHQAERYLPCAAVLGVVGTPVDLCEHGNYPNQRRDCCGTTVQARREPALPEHLRGL